MNAAGGTIVRTELARAGSGKCGDAGLTAAELDAHCRASGDLAAFKRPKRVVFVRGLPKSPVGKLLRRLLVAGEYDTV